jgi:predicted acyl esterase
MTRDGVALRTVVSGPTGFATNGVKYGTVLIRTPYNADGLAGEAATYVQQGFVALAQDFRGEGRPRAWCQHRSP